MQTFNRLRLTILALFATFAGCVTTPGSAPEGQRFASDAVIREMHETRPAFAKLAPNQQAIVYLWLLASCAVGEVERRAEFVKLGTRHEGALIEAFRMGPPVALLAEIADRRRSDHAAIKGRLNGEDRELFGPELRERLTAVSERDYVDAGIERTIASYRLAALNGLANIGSQTSIEWLERTALTLKDPELRDAAARTLTALRDRLRR